MNCNIAYDLIPMYADGLCSEETAREMEKHLEGCRKCSENLKNYRSDVPDVKPSGTAPKKAFRKVRIYVVVSAVIIGLILITGGLGGVYGLYAANIGYMSADKAFFGYDTERIMRSCDKMLLRSVSVFFVYDTTENNRKWTDDMPLEEYNGIRRALDSSEIDYSSLMFRELRNSDGKTKRNCEFIIDGMLGDGERYCNFSARFLRLGIGKYYLIECTVMPASERKTLFDGGYVLNVNLLADLSEAREYDISDDGALLYVYYTYHDGAAPDGEYISSDGDTVTVDGGIIRSITYGESEYYDLDGEFVYPDRTERKRVLYPKAGFDPRRGDFINGYAIIMGDGKLIIGDTEYHLSVRQ